MRNRLVRQNSAFSKSASTPAPNPFQSRPFAPVNQVSPQSQEAPDLQQQLEQPKNLGFNFANVTVTPREAKPLGVLQRRLRVGEPGIQHQEELDKDKVIRKPEAGILQREEMIQRYFVYKSGDENPLTKEEVKQYMEQEGLTEEQKEFVRDHEGGNSKRVLFNWIEKAKAISRQNSEKRRHDKEAESDSEDTRVKQPRKKHKKPDLAFQENFEEDNGKEERETASVRDIFKEILNNINLQNEVIKSIAVDWDLEKNIDESYLQVLDVKQIASCFQTAERLFNLIGDPASDATNTWNVQREMKTAIPSLIQDIVANKNSACIYRCGINEVAHGFTIILQNGQADIIQGFAGSTGESLSENIEDEARKEGYSVKELITELGNLLSSKPQTTLDAQNKLFSGSVDIEKISKQDQEAIKKARNNKNLQEAHKDDQTDDKYLLFYRELNQDIFQYERRGLYSQEELKKRIEAKILNNLTKLGIKVNKR